MAQTKDDIDKGEGVSDEGDDRDKEGEQGGGLRAISPMPLGEDKAAGLLLKPDTGVKSMDQENWRFASQKIGLGGWQKSPHQKNPIVERS